MTKITNLPITAIIAGTLIALAVGPAFAQANNVPEQLDNLLNLLEPKTIFVSSTTHDGDLGGLDGADAMCQALADDVDGGSIVPAGDYVALLSTDDVSAAERVPPNVGSFVRPDGVPVAANFATLFGTRFVSGDLDLNNPVQVDETGGFVSEQVWRGSGIGGETINSQNCSGWVDSGATAVIGFSGVGDAGWGTRAGSPPLLIFHVVRSRFTFTACNYVRGLGVRVASVPFPGSRRSPP